MGQGVIAPSASLDHDNASKGNYIPKEADKNDYCYFDGEKILISMDQGDTFQYDPFILNAAKLGNALVYTVKFNDSYVTAGNKITFDTAGEYMITYTYEDPYNYRLNKNGEPETFTETYVKTDFVSVAIVEPEAKHAVFTYATENTATEEILYNNNTYISAKNVTEDGTKWGKITVGDKSIVYPIVTANVKRNTTKKECQVFYYVFKDVISIKDANDTEYSHDNGTGTDGTMPSNLKVVKGNELKVENNVFTNYNDTNLSRTGGKIFCYSASSQIDDPALYNNALAYKSPSGLSYKSSRNYDAAVIVQYQFTDSNNATYYYYVGYKINNPAGNGPWGDNDSSSSGSGSSPCVTPDTLVTLADGTQKRIDEISYDDKLLVWNFYEGKYDIAPIAIIFDHGADNNTVIKLTFSDGSNVKVVNMHQFYDNDLRKLVTINEETVAGYVGHKFAKHNNGNTDFVELTSYSVSKEYVEAWGIMTAKHYNIITADMVSADFDSKDVELFNYFEIGEDMKYDAEKMQSDIEKYGLYTYADFADYLTYEQFVAFNVQYFKIPVEKGLYTYDGILELIDYYLN